MAEQVDALSPAGVAELANFIIRPPRATYNPVELGEKRFTCEKVQCIRHDVELDTTRGLTIMGSHFRPLHAPEDLPTVVYMHGNGSCRVEGTMLLHYALPYGLALFSFDFTGSGMSGGEYISLGVYEKYDVQAVVDHLVEDRGVKRIVLWGHSMGAATAVMYSGLCKRRPEVKGLVLDSPFASFEKLAQSMVSEMPLPIAVPRKLILSVGVRAVRKVVREKAAFDVMDIDPLSAAKRINYELPALFLHGTADAVVPVNHGELLHKHFPCSEKQFITLRNSEHDSPRPEWAMDKVHIFLQKHLREYGVSDLQFLEQIKARGNAAMLAGRFRDANVLYTEALNALSENVVAVKFANAVGEPVPDRLTDTEKSDEGAQKLTRKNSSISNLVNSVKRWRRNGQSRGSEKAFSLRSGLSSRVYTDFTNDPKFAGQISADIMAVPSPEPGMSADFGLPDDRSSGREESTPSGPTEEFKHSVVSGDEITDTQSTQDNPKSEEATMSGRFGRPKRNWRTRQWVQSLKNTIMRHHQDFEGHEEDLESEQFETSEVEDETQDDIERNAVVDLQIEPIREKKYKHSSRLFNREPRGERQSRQSGLFRREDRREERRRPSGRMFQKEQKTTGHLFYSEGHGLGNKQHVGLFSKESRYAREPRYYRETGYRENEYDQDPYRSNGAMSRRSLQYQEPQRSNGTISSRRSLQVDGERRPGRLFYRTNKKDSQRRQKSEANRSERRLNAKRLPSDELQDNERTEDEVQVYYERPVDAGEELKMEQKQRGGLFRRENKAETGRKGGAGLFNRKNGQDQGPEYSNGFLEGVEQERFERHSESGKPMDRPDQNALGRLPRRAGMKRSQSSGKLSRSLSSSRLHMRNRERRREGGRRERHMKGAEDVLGRHTPADSDDRFGKTNEIGHGSRHLMNESQPTLKESGMRRSQTDGNLNLGEGISNWDMSEAQKSIVLALLGNRSLARRKLHDNSGALFDSVICLQLDPTWIRGYLRKAAALREEGKLEQARKCVLEGLRADPDHAGLTDMLQSIELETEAEQLAVERNQATPLESYGNRPDVIAGQA